MNKKVITIFLIYFIQFIATSCFSCDCAPIKTFERTYNGLELKAWDTSGFRNEEVINSAYINAFGLTISVQFELNQVSFSKPMLDMSSLGFTSAYAMSDCDCPMDEYINIDPIVSLKINVTNLENQEIIDVTDNFTTYHYNGEQLTISELFKIREDWHDGFQLDMSEYGNIPDLSLFTVIVHLETGTELIAQTQEITFE
ncbi:MAG: hypothetical protein P8H23_04740 [Flavobacteriaceae bacterium]|nr:hypothetical protein [Flavobacteriaceae bacterium]